LNKYIKRAFNIEDRNPLFDDVLPQMKSITLDAVKATYLSLDPSRREHNFELFGMDFMLDNNLKPWLIEINTNPCLEICCPLLASLIPELLEQTLRLCVDPLFPPPE
jgi:tubulin---tyrosine ligase